MKSESGLTLVELLVSSAIMLMIFAMVFTAFIQARKISNRTQMDAEILQNARIGLDEMVRMIRMAGYGRDVEHGQVTVIEAAPFQIIFNADLHEKPAFSPSETIPLYDATLYEPPLQNYTTQAETYRWTLDTNNDGIVDQQDTRKDEEVIATAWNPNDMVLNREINGGQDAQVTVGVLGPYDFQDEPTYITPMFQYWLKEPDGTFSLLGDEDDNLSLTEDEIYFRSITSQLILNKVRRIQITLTVESDQFDPFDQKEHRRVVLSSEVSLRNAD